MQSAIFLRLFTSCVVHHATPSADYTSLITVVLLKTDRKAGWLAWWHWYSKNSDQNQKWFGGKVVWVTSEMSRYGLHVKVSVMKGNTLSSLNLQMQSLHCMISVVVKMHEKLQTRDKGTKNCQSYKYIHLCFSMCLIFREMLWEMAEKKGLKGANKIMWSPLGIDYKLLLKCPSEISQRPVCVSFCVCLFVCVCVCVHVILYMMRETSEFLYMWNLLLFQRENILKLIGNQQSRGATFLKFFNQLTTAALHEDMNLGFLVKYPWQ